jgi:predicted N-acetyltransferase YhbS
VIAMTLSLAATRAAKPPPPLLRSEQPADAPLVAGLIERAFGPGRYAKAAERLRETNSPLLDISLVAWAGERLVGCVRMWPVHIGQTPAVFLGPFAVEPTYRSAGLGARLIRQACAAAADAGHDLILLVGAGAYFKPLGFAPVAPHRITLPGPVDPDRVFTLELTPGAAANLAGPVRAG